MNSKSIEQKIISWQSSLYIDHNRGKVWYILATLIAVTTIILSFIFGSKLFGLVVVFLCLAYFPLTLKKAPIVQVSVSTKGIHFGEHFYPYSDIEYFWIEEYLPSYQSLHLQIKQSRISDLEIQFYDHSKDEIIGILQQFVPHNLERTPSLFNHLAHALKL